MTASESWDWQAGKKVLADLAQIRSSYPRVDEFVVSPDGERIVAPVKTGRRAFTIAVNGEPWSESFELCWYPRFSRLGRLTALVRIDDEWTVAVEGQPWKERFEYVWNPLFSADDGAIAVACKRDNAYRLAVDDAPWEEGFPGMRDFCVSPDGSSAAATVQVEALKEADVSGFFKGVWSVAVDGKAWNERYVNAWNPTFSADGKAVAAEIRTDICEYSIAVNAEPWPSRFGSVWAPAFDPRNGSVVAPVRHEGSWRLFKDGEPLWDGHYNQMWQQRFSPDGSKIAAVVSPEFGKWTIAVDDRPWSMPLLRHGPGSHLLAGWRAGWRHHKGGKPLVHGRGRGTGFGRFRYGLGPGVQPLRATCCGQGGIGRQVPDPGGRKEARQELRQALGSRIQS